MNKSPIGTRTAFKCLICGALATHGLNVQVRKDKGDWYCVDHFRLTPDGQAMQARFLRQLSEIDNDA